MLQIKRFVFNPFEVNTYILYDDTNECLVVDAGCYGQDERKDVVDFISSNRLTPKLIVNTHGHVDHVLGNGFLKEEYAVDILGHAADNQLIENANKHGMIFGLRVETPPPLNRELVHNDTIRFGRSELSVIHTPGHSPGGICLHSVDGNFIITGDSLFRSSIGRTDLPGGDFDTLMDSITTRLLSLNENLTIYPGHGPASTIGWERGNNPFLNSM